MSNNPDWVPIREHDLVDLCQLWKLGLENADNIAAFGWHEEDCAYVLAEIESFLLARDAFELEDSTSNRVKKNAAKAAVKRALRGFANTSMRFNKRMNDADRFYYGIQPAGKPLSHDSAPETYPEARVDTSVLRQIGIHFRDSATKKRGKPHGIHGAACRWALLERPPASIDELSRMDFVTASPLTLRFDEAQRGKRLYFCLRWESNTSLKGPFGEICNAVIP